MRARAGLNQPPATPRKQGALKDCATPAEKQTLLKAPHPQNSVHQRVANAALLLRREGALGRCRRCRRAAPAAAAGQLRHSGRGCSWRIGRWPQAQLGCKGVAGGGQLQRFAQGEIVHAARAARHTKQLAQLARHSLGACAKRGC